MKENAKLDALGQLTVAANKAFFMAIKCYESGDDENSVLFLAKKTELEKMAMSLRGQISDEWCAEAEQILSQIREANQAIQQSAAELASSVQTVKNISLALDFLQKVIELAAKFAP